MSVIGKLYKTTVFANSVRLRRQYGVFSNAWNKYKERKRQEELVDYLIGRDNHGNYYYEKLPSSSSSTGRSRRWIEHRREGGIGDVAEVTENIPVEWSAWLQFKRKHPPTDEEIQRNEMYLRKTRIRAHVIEESRMSSEEEQETNENHGENLKSSQNKLEESSTEFKIYPEYNTKPK